jgi:plasmid maintenance system killer protein
LRFRFARRRLERLFYENKGAGKYPPGVVESFYDAMTVIGSAGDERDLRAMSGWRMKKLVGDPEEKSEIRLNRQFRLIVRIEEDENGAYVLIIDLKDPHKG